MGNQISVKSPTISQNTQAKTDWPLYKSITLPVDKDGYAQTFDITNYDPKEVKSFYDKFGVVVFSNIITEEQILKTIDDLWNQTIECSEQMGNMIDRNDPKTWNFFGLQRSFGFVNNQPIHQLQNWKNRANPKVYKCFKDLFQITSGKELKQPLISCLDRGSMMRPTKQNPEWQTESIYHFDIDPWHWTGLREQTYHIRFERQYEKFGTYSYMLGQGNQKPNVGFTKLAGVLALSDTNETSGGFQAALGFQNYIKKWCEKKDVGTSIESDKELLKTFQKVTARKGSLIVFSRQLPHNIYPNKSQNFRYAQYLRMTPLSTLMLTPLLIEKRKALIHPMIPKQLERTKICKELFMLNN